MSSRMEGDVYASLPPELPPKGARHRDDITNLVERMPSERLRKVKIVHGRDRRHPDDEEAYPRVEARGSPKRDSGKFYVTTTMSDGEPSIRRKEYERHRRHGSSTDADVEKLYDDLEREKRHRREAERAAAHAEEKATKYKDQLDRVERERSIEKRERDILEREKRLSQEREKRLSQEREMERERERDRAHAGGGRVVEIRPRPVVTRDRHDTVVVHNSRDRDSREMVPGGASALDRARSDFNVQQRRQQFEERRPLTSGGRGHIGPQQVVIVDDNDDDYRVRPRR